MTTHDLFSELNLASTLLVRHKLKVPQNALRYPDAFAAFQEVQKAGAFKDARAILSFVPTERTHVRFVGAWAVDGSEPGHAVSDAEIERLAAAERKLGEALTREHIRTVWRTSKMTRYRLSPISQYDDFIGDVVVDWGPGARAWVQWADRQPKDLV